MGKSVHNDMLDAALNYIKNNVTRLVVCSTQPTTFTEANVTYALADVTVDDSDFTVGDGDTSGRKVTTGAQNAVTVDANGSAQHIAYLDVDDSKLVYVTTCSAKTIYAGDQVNIPAHDIEILDPA